MFKSDSESFRGFPRLFLEVPGLVLVGWDWCWLVVLGLTGLSDSISVYIELSPRAGEKKENLIGERKISKQLLQTHTANTADPCHTIIKNGRTPQH